MSNSGIIAKKIVTLASANPSLTHAAIAKLIGRSTKTVQRAMNANADVIQSLQETIHDQLVEHLNTLQSGEDAALNYVELAMSAKNEAVRLGAQSRIDDLRGIVTEKEKIRAKRDEPQRPQAMFQLAAGVSVNVTINQKSVDRHTTYSNDAGKSGDVIVTPGKSNGHV